jgi:hypothetical protein
MNTATSTAPAQRSYRSACAIDHKTGPSHLYALSVYACPNGHEPFYSYAVNGAVSWNCPDCQSSGNYVGCDGEAHTFLRHPRPTKGRYQLAQVGLLSQPETQEHVLKLIKQGISEPLSEHHFAVQGFDLCKNGRGMVDQLLVCGECCSETEWRRVKLEMVIGTGRYEWHNCELHEQQYQRSLADADQ